MASQPNQSLEIINKMPQGTGTFPQFPKLPLELRAQIWEQSLCQERLIRVELLPGKSPEDLHEDKEPIRRQDEYAAGRQTESFHRRSGSFLIVLRNKHEISKVFRVCFESRKVAQRFYRVQLPCYCKELGSPATEGIFYFHPELDILDISGQEFPPSSHICGGNMTPGELGLSTLRLQ